VSRTGKDQETLTSSGSIVLRTRAALWGLPLVVVLVFTLIVHLGFLNPTELQGYDLLVLTARRPAPEKAIVVVDFDNPSMKMIGKYPVPREVLADVVERVVAGEPAVVGLDKLLSEPSTPVADRRLADSLSRARSVILADAFMTAQIPANEPLSIFCTENCSLGFANLIQDDDGFVRRMMVFVKSKEFSGLSFPVQVVSAYLLQALKRVSPEVFQLGAITIHLDGTGRNTALIGDWSHHPAELHVSVEQLLSDSVDVQSFKDKIVLIGESSAAGKDLYATPLFRLRDPAAGPAKLSGVEVQATAIRSLLSGGIITVASPQLQLLAGFFFVVSSCFFVLGLRPQFGIPAVLGLGIVLFVLGLWLFSSNHIWLRFVTIEAGIGVALVVGSTVRFWQEQLLKSQAELATRHEAEQRKKLDDELEQAREIQESLLPSALPQAQGLQIAARYEPALQIGGDYYDFFQPESHRLLFVIADVQGHGVASALIMSNLQAILRNVVHGPRKDSLTEIVTTLNEAVAAGTTGKLVSLFLGEFDLTARALKFVNAGHVKPLLLKAGDPLLLMLADGGMLLGVFAGNTYESGSVRLDAGDVVIALTDGITEAQNAAREEYSSERVEAVGRTLMNHSAEEILDGLFSDVREFERGGKHEDDKVVLVFKCL
jgi:serine phosphatase RsbU (regulator of sigma subunit)/CHASE2 domain-containing sensor protein